MDSVYYVEEGDGSESPPIIYQSYKDSKSFSL